MTSKQIRYWTAGISVASGILALGDKAVAFPDVPGWLTSCWPFVLAGAAIFNNVAHILITPDPVPQGSLPDPQAFRAPLGVPQKP